MSRVSLPSSSRNWRRRRRPRLCRCHSVVDDCCPDRLRGVIDAGATRVGVHAAGGAPGADRLDDRPYAPQDRTRHRQQIEDAVPRGGAVSVCDGLCQPDLGVDVRQAPRRQRRRRLFGRRLSAGRDDGRRQGLRDAAGDLRRRARSGHGHQRRRAQVGRSGDRRARHRSGHRALPRLRRDEQGDHRSRAADRRRESDCLHARQGGGRRLREDLDRIRPRRRDRGRCRADAPGRGRKWGSRRRRHPDLQG